MAASSAFNLKLCHMVNSFLKVLVYLSCEIKSFLITQPSPWPRMSKLSCVRPSIGASSNYSEFLLTLMMKP